MYDQIDPGLLLARLEARRVELGALRSQGEGAEPLSWVEVASQVGIHSASFSRLKTGKIPGDATMERLLTWLGISDPFELVVDPDAEVVAGETLEIDVVDDAPEEAICAHEGCTDVPTHGQGEDGLSVLYCATHAIEHELELLQDGGGCGCEHSEESAAVAAAASDDKVAAILGYGRLSESEDPETQAAVLRVRELMAEGAVGVSIMHDLNPADMPDQEEIDRLVAEEDWDALDALFENIQARPRHVAIVDTPAFSDARLDENEDGTVSGPVVFEGLWTGDQRLLPYGVLTWDDDLLPIPIIWDRSDGDHTGMTVGFIDKLERQDGVTSALRPEVSEDAVVAAAGTTALPAKAFAKFKVDRKIPMKVDAPDAFGRRRIWGIAAPKGVCHRSDMGACFQFPGDVDPNMGNFHTGFEVALDDGTTIRPGAITSGGLHIDTGLAKRGVSAREVNRHREDSNKVLALVRAWDTPFGLAVSGVLAANVTEEQLLQAMAGGPSVELWPSGRGRTLVGIHVVPTQAWPVVASMGDAMEFTSPDEIEVEDAPKPVKSGTLKMQMDLDSNAFGLLNSRLDRIEKALSLLITDRIADGIPEPE